AIKVLHREMLSSPRLLQAFLDEARILAKLEHPGIVPVYDIGHTDDGQHFIVSKLIEGESMQQRLLRAPVSIDMSVELVASLAEALHFAHKQGLVHRDVKPANILLDDERRALLTDFGLALRQADLGTGPADVGTPLYMSPEQARNQGQF